MCRFFQKQQNTHAVTGKILAHAGPVDRSDLERPASQFMQLSWEYFASRISHYKFERKLVNVFFAT